MVQESLEDAVLAKESSQPQSSYEVAAMLTEFELKKILIDKMDKSESYLEAPEHRECYDGSIKYYDLDKTIFFTYSKVTNKGPKAKESQSGSSKGTKSESKSSEKSVQLEEPEFEVADLDMPQDQEENPSKDDEEPKEKVASKRDWQSNSSKGHLRRHGLNIWSVLLMSPIFNAHARWGFLIGEKTVKVMKKHGYGYQKEIVVRRADNDLYRFKEGDFPHLRINAIKDMLLLVVQNRLINLLGDDISDFAIALRMFTRSLIIQMLVKDLQSGQKLPEEDHVTKRTTKILNMKRDHTLHIKTLKEFFYRQKHGKTRLMR
ncbi:hypothetical protein Tco_1156034 [Tanacetum coccineum]